MNPPYIRIYPPGHCFGNAKLWIWQVCSLNDIEMSGSSDDMQEAMDMAMNAWRDVSEANK